MNMHGFPGSTGGCVQEERVTQEETVRTREQVRSTAGEEGEHRGGGHGEWGLPADTGVQIFWVQGRVPDGM